MFNDELGKIFPIHQLNFYRNYIPMLVKWNFVTRKPLRISNKLHVKFQ